MDDIARLAGVSKSAVSLALNGKPGVSEETRANILRIAKEHGYTVKSRSASLTANQGTITFLVFNSGIVLEQYYEQPFFREMIHYIEERCRMKGYSLIYRSADHGALDDLPNALGPLNGDGVILLGTNLHKDHIAAIAEHIKTPLVVLDTCFDTLPVNFVQINNVMGAYHAGAHLYELGHRRIGYIESSIRIQNFEERKLGFIEALMDRGLELSSHYTLSVVPTILTSQESLKQQFASIFSQKGQMPTAFFCECDYIAISALKTLTELGYRVPEDISIIGFDNITESCIVTPQLTTVHVAKKQVAYQAVDLLLHELETKEKVGLKIRVDTEFMERDSTAALERPPG